MQVTLVRHAVEQAITRVFAVEPTALWSLSRGHPRVAFARQVGMYVAHVALGLSLTQVGDLFCRDRTTVAHACAVVEDRRDDGTFDRTLELLEQVVRMLSPGAGRGRAGRGEHAHAAATHHSPEGPTP